MENPKFIIEYVKLKNGLHTFNYTVKELFFENSDNARAHKSDIAVVVNFEKSFSLSKMKIYVNGKFKKECDRCLQVINSKLEGNELYILKEGENNKVKDEEENIIYIGKNDFKLDITSNIIDVIHNSILIQDTCENNGGICDENMKKWITGSIDGLEETNKEK